MAIHLDVTVEDQDLENLLRYLSGQKHLDRSSKQMLVESALEWLKRADKYTYTGNIPVVTLSLGDNSGRSAAPQELVSLPQQEKGIGQIT